MAEIEIRNGVGIIPGGTKKIDAAAFMYNNDLTSIVIPDTVTIIEDIPLVSDIKQKNPCSVKQRVSLLWCCKGRKVTKIRSSLITFGALFPANTSTFLPFR